MVAGTATAVLQSISPHDQSVVGEVPVSTAEDVRAAVQMARAAAPDWARTSIDDRIGYIARYRNELLNAKDQIAWLVSVEMGKPLSQSLDEVDFELEFLDYYIDQGPVNLADETVHESPGHHFRVAYEPYGVAAVIAPWNFPVGMAHSGIVPALIAGNTVVFKPSEHTTLSQRYVVDLMVAADLPEGVLNLVVGDGAVGQMLLSSPVDLVWFTGSTRVGREIYRLCGDRFIKSICELGGSSPGIVLGDADLDQTIDSLYWARFLNCGQVCSAIKRLFVDRSIYEEVVERLSALLQTKTIGNPVDDPDLGPLVSAVQRGRLEEQVADARQQGATIRVGGVRPQDQGLAAGAYYTPTLLTNLTPQMRVMREEVFGPVLPVSSFDSDAEAVELANDTEYGLSAQLFTRDRARAGAMARDLRAGVVAINTNDYYKPSCPVGGMKQSGMGREYGRIGMQEFAQAKLLAVAHLPEGN